MEEAAIYWGSLGLMITLHDCITASEYEAILQNEGHPVVQNPFPCDARIYQDDNTTPQNKLKSGFMNTRKKSHIF